MVLTHLLSVTLTFARLVPVKGRPDAVDLICMGGQFEVTETPICTSISCERPSNVI